VKKLEVGCGRWRWKTENVRGVSSLNGLGGDGVTVARFFLFIFLFGKIAVSIEQDLLLAGLARRSQ
jgi:hypothetical protein